MEIFCVDKVKPYVTLTLKDPLDPFREKGYIHGPGCNNPNTTLVFGLAHQLPFDHVVLLLLVAPLPKEAGYLLVPLGMDPFGEQVQTHKEHGQARKTRVNKDRLRAFASELTPLGSIQDLSRSTSGYNSWIRNVCR